MKKLIFPSVVIALMLVITGCPPAGNGELTGVMNREIWYEPDPYGMLFIPMGSYNMGPNDQDVPWAMTAQSKTVSIQAFWMDETEITNNEYRQFCYWVRDSLAYKILAGKDGNGNVPANKRDRSYLKILGADDDIWYEPDEMSDLDEQLITSNPFINWRTEIDWKVKDAQNELERAGFYYPPHERYYRRKEFDVRKWNFEYYWIDLQQAAKKFYYTDKDQNGLAIEKTRTYHHFDINVKEDNNGEKKIQFRDFKSGQFKELNQQQVTINGDFEEYGGIVDNDPVKYFNERGEKVNVRSRASFIMKDVINVYPDTLCWVRDFSYSYNEPMTKMYFWHPAYDHYPVVGVSWKQARAFSIWRTQLLNGFLAEGGQTFVQDFRLPTESEWEYASRGGLDLSMYPWGGYYTRNYTGCFIANFKPLRGDYRADGGFHTVIVASFDPNDYGLYDMAGNVAEWTRNAFDESAYSFTDDLNPDYFYEAREEDHWQKKRKVLRGGSWKDIGYYMQCGTRTYEYQDTAKSFIGFRNVRTYLGRDKNDDVSRSQVY
ncbi:MAG: SUMF1/EgtB/PvdO family nonheme iron enzyme [Bacteroidales bacterium]|nr:SUMF1/EgtB/PvdO family nonheme iron enzyme [Bacteroidales bacterium]